MRLTFLMMTLIVATCVGMAESQAQDRIAIKTNVDLVERVRTYPPQSDFDATQKVLESISWQMDLKQELMSRYLDDYRRDLEKNVAELRRLTKQLPPEIKFVDKTVRSHLIGKAMEELLDAQLDLATRDSSVKQFESMLVEAKKSKRSDLMKRQSQIEIETAAMKVRMAETEYLKIKQLTSKGSKSQREQQMAEYTLAIAQLELQAATTRAEVAGKELDAELASRLTDARIEIEPVKARIAAIEKFLKKFVDSAEIASKIEEKQREVENLQKRLHQRTEDVSRLRLEFEELSVLKSRIERHLKKIAAEQADKTEKQK